MSLIIWLIVAVLSDTFFRESAVSPEMRAPLFTASIVSSIKLEVFCAAFADFCARFPTSSATTAKPFPATPALAASIAAFRERIFVWKAISSMVLMILLISLDFSVMSCIARESSCILSLLSHTASPASLLISEAFSAIPAVSLIFSEMSFIVALSSSMEEACSVAPCESVCEPLLTCSAPLFTSVAEEVISLMVCDKSSVISFNEARSGRYAPW